MYQYYYKKYKETKIEDIPRIHQVLYLCFLHWTVLLALYLGKEQPKCCTRPEVLWGSVHQLCWKHLSHHKPTFTVIECFKKTVTLTKNHCRGTAKILRPPGVISIFSLQNNFSVLDHAAQCLQILQGNTSYYSTIETKLKEKFQSIHNATVYP